MNKNASNFYPTQQFHMFLHIVKLSEIESSPIKNTSWTAKVEFMWIHGRFTKLTPSKILLVTFCLAPLGKFRPLPQRFKQNVIEFFRGSPTISKFLLHFCGKNLLDRKNLCVVLSLRWDFWGFGPRKWNPNSSTCLWVAYRWSLSLESEKTGGKMGEF